MKPSCSIFIPAFNAGETISTVFERIPPDLWESIVRLYVINDGSTDNTASIVNALAGNYRGIELVSFDLNRGYGVAVSKGLQLCINTEADYIICLHADGQYPPEKICQFLSYMDENNLDILQGSRHRNDTALAGGMPLYKYIAGKCLVRIENRVFGLKLTDYHSGYMFYRHSALKNMPIEKLSTSFDIDLELIALGKSLGLNISELGIPTRYADEVSYLNPLIYGLRVLRIMYRYITGYYDSLANEITQQNR